MDIPLRSIHVVAGVITDARGRVLLARRKQDSDQPGLWEFPGGKREQGESSEAALARELNEELGIDVESVGAPFIEVPQLYSDKRLRLEVRKVLAWQGTPRGREGQALTWVTPDKLAKYSMPPADRPAVGALLAPDKYLVTPTPASAGSGDDAVWLDGIRNAVDAGIARIQLRQRGVDAARWHALVEQAVQFAQSRNVSVLVNGDVGLAREFGIGVHLRAAQLAGLEARPLVEDVLVAASCHTVEELQKAQNLGCDFAVLGPVKQTATHPHAAPLGWDGFASLRENVSLPIYALGGLTADDIADARKQGAQGIAAIRGLWHS